MHDSGCSPSVRSPAAAALPPVSEASQRVQHFASSKRQTHYRTGAMSTLKRTPLSSLLYFAWRTAFRLGFPLALIWWRLARPRHEGAVVAVYVGPALLLVRTSYLPVNIHQSTGAPGLSL
jgi:hypothetical protein